MNETRYVVAESGEILEELNSRDRILRNGTVKYLSGTEVIRFNFGKINVDCIKHIKNCDLRYAMDLLEYIELGSGILKFKNGRTINSASKMGKIFNVHDRTAQIIVRRLIKEDIIHRIKDNGGTYFVYNPYIMHIGKRVPKDLIKEFYDTDWRNYTDEDYKQIREGN